MDFDLGGPKVLELFLKLKQYPILSRRIREKMREELFHRGIITLENFEKEVRREAVDSQRRECLDESSDEPQEVWDERLAAIRDNLTDFYFAHNFPPGSLEHLVQETLTTRSSEEVVLTVNPELAPWSILFALGEQYEKLPPERLKKVRHHLQESIVVLTKGMLSDQLDYVGIARKTLSIAKLREINSRRVGRGKIGGKAAGLILAATILLEPEERENLSSVIQVPDSWFIAADVYYEFQALNGLMEFMNQKYRSREEIVADHPRVVERYTSGVFPPYVTEAFRNILREAEGSPLVARSSSLLEDNFGFSFAGKYDSFFLPNQGTPEENLADLHRAVAAIYASTLAPDALVYRKHMGLLDYDERMAVLIQKVVGAPYRGRFFPALSGVAFSKNPHRWDRRIRREDGMVRLVVGLGTRAVDRTPGEHPRMIALSHPGLRPESMEDIPRHAQKSMDVLDLGENRFTTAALRDAVGPDFPGYRFLVSVFKDGIPRTPLFLREEDPDSTALTFDELISRTNFCPLMKKILATLERRYKRPVDIEFSVRELPGGRSGGPREVEITLLQCRPLSLRAEMKAGEIPSQLDPARVLFTADSFVPDGLVEGLRHIVWIDPRVYDSIDDPVRKTSIARLVGRLNARLEKSPFLLMGPGRWGSSNIDLGVPVGFADINNARMLIEVALLRDGHTPEVSFGTHFFQDLVEAGIYPLSLYPDKDGIIFNSRFLRESGNVLGRLLPEDRSWEPWVKVIDVSESAGGGTLTVVMNGEVEKAVGYLT